MDGVNRMSVKELPIPVPKDDEVLIRIAYCGICATDYDNFAGISSFTKEGRINFPLRWGHEWSGRICAVGKDVHGLHVGDRAIGEGKITCGVCGECLAGRWYNCPEKRTIGTVGDAWPGGMAEYIVMPERNTIKLGDRIGFMEAAAMEATSVAMNGLRGLELEGKTLLITGSGPIGLSGVPVAKAMGAKKVIVAARKKPKLDLALRLGADAVINTTEADIYESVSALTDGVLADVVLETSGEASFVENLVRLTRVSGAFSMVGFYTRLISGLIMDDIVFNKITLYGRCGSHDCTPELARMIDDGRVNITPIITSVIDFYEHGADCMDEYLAAKDSGSKMLVKIYGEDA